MKRSGLISQWTVSFWIGVAAWTLAQWCPSLRHGAWLAHELIVAAVAPVMGAAGVRLLDGAPGSAVLSGGFLALVAAPGGMFAERLASSSRFGAARRIGVGVTALIFVHGALWLQSATSVSARLNPQPLRTLFLLAVATLVGWIVARLLADVRFPRIPLLGGVAGWSPVFLVIAALGAHWWALPAVPVDARLAGDPVLVVGLDGANWEQVSRLAEDGQLPGLSRLLEGGTGGPMSSVVPVLSPAAWTTAASGKRVWQHDIGGFLRGEELFSSQDWAARPIWSIAAEAGLRVLVVNWYVTWPAVDDHGTWVVSDRFHLPDLDARIYPGSATAWIDSIVDGSEADIRAIFSDSFGNAPEATLDPVGAAAHRHLWREVRRDWAASRIALELVDQQPWDVVFLYLRSTDGAQHRYWREHVGARGPWWENLALRAIGRPVEPGGIDVVSRCYRLLDRWITEVADGMGAQTRLLALSDHGAGMRLGVPGRANLNPLLVALGHLALDPEGEVESEGTWLEDITPTGQQDPWTRQVRVLEERGSVESAGLLLRGLVTEEGDGVFSRVASDSDSLLQIRLARGLPGGASVRLPDGGMFPVKKFSSVGIRGDFSGSHRIDGMYWTNQPAHGFVGRASLVDVAPTLLTWLGLPVGMDMEGRPLPLGGSGKPVGTVDSHEKPRADLVENPSQDGADRISGALKALGYLD